MPQATITHILEEIRTLEPDDLREVERTVRGLLEPSPKEAEREAALKALQEAGIVKEIKRPDMRSRREWPLVPIQGKPLSETIIEDRR